jgi:hypothetical protein
MLNYPDVAKIVEYLETHVKSLTALSVSLQNMLTTYDYNMSKLDNVEFATKKEDGSYLLVDKELEEIINETNYGGKNDGSN